MFICLSGLNTTEVSYAGAPSVEEQMMLFHTGPLDVVPETIETTKADMHKQQAIEATVLPTPGSQGSRCLDPNEPCQRGGLGEVAPAASTKRRRGRGSMRKLMIPGAFGLGLLAGVGACWLMNRR